MIDAHGLMGVDPDVIAEIFTDETLIAMLEQIDAEREEERYGKFRNLFPDMDQCASVSSEGFRFKSVGEFRFYARDYYRKHMEFFKYGATARARCLMAANRVGKCRVYSDLVPHPDGTVSKIGELFERQQPFDVLAWDGSKTVRAAASAVIRKPPEQVVEVLLSSGETFTASLDHRILTARGWSYLSDALLSAPCLPASTGEPDPITHALDVPHWWQKVLGCWADCSEDHHLGDAPPLDAVTLVLEFGPSLADAPRHSPVSSPSGAAVRECSGSPSLSASLLANSGDRRRLLARSAGFLTRAAYRSARRNTGSHRVAKPPLAGLIALLRLAGASVRALFGPVALVTPGSKATNRVVAYRPAGIHALYDMTVPGLHNYVADGIVHHNTFSAGGFETACHLTGDYPHWWPGKRFRHPIRAWACGKTNETTRDIVQTTLLGDIEYRGSRKLVDGSGVIPKETVGSGPGQVTWKQGVADLIDTIRIRHVSGGWSKLGLKSYQQGRGAFEGTAQHVIWDDEEPPMDVYGEQIIRTATTKGILMLTFTPLEGMSDVVQQFLPSNDFEL